MQKKPPTRPVDQDDLTRNDASADAQHLESGDHVSGHRSPEDRHRERADGEDLDPAAGRYGGYGGLREPDSASRVEPPVIDHNHSGFEREYLAWRDEQLRSFDSDYRSWRDEGNSRFNQDFESWRRKRRREAASGGNADSSQAETHEPSASNQSSGSTS